MRVRRSRFHERADSGAARLSAAQDGRRWIGWWICAAAAETARSTSLLLELVSEFDAIGGMKHWTGFKSLAHWLSWSLCDDAGSGTGACPGR